MAFLVFEGLDGSGKSTLISGLERELVSRQINSVVTREPGGTELGEEIRQLLLRTDAQAPVPRAELFLYQAGRAQHVDLVIRPALARGDWVLCDRFYASTSAFQCGGRGLDRAQVDPLNRLAVGGCEPQLTVLLDLSVEESARRRAHREQSSGVQADRFEREKLAFHQRVRDFYLQLAAEANAAPANSAPVRPPTEGAPSQGLSSAPVGRSTSPAWLVLDAENSSPEQLLQALLHELKRRQWLK